MTISLYNEVLGSHVDIDCRGNQQRCGFLTVSLFRYDVKEGRQPVRAGIRHPERPEEEGITRPTLRPDGSRDIRGHFHRLSELIEPHTMCGRKAYLLFSQPQHGCKKEGSTTNDVRGVVLMGFQGVDMSF